MEYYRTRSCEGREKKENKNSIRIDGIITVRATIGSTNTKETRNGAIDTRTCANRRPHTHTHTHTSHTHAYNHTHAATCRKLENTHPHVELHPACRKTFNSTTPA